MRKFYAGLTSGTRRAFLLGPYDTRDQAEINVARAHEAAVAVDAYTWFATPGVLALDHDRHPDGRLNATIGRVAPDDEWLWN